MKVKNKVIVVTGGGSGLGRALVLGLLNKGAKVIAVDKNFASLAETMKLALAAQLELTIHELDLTQKETVHARIDDFIRQHGNVDGLINNAGMIHPFAPLHELDYETIERVFNINFFGTLYLTKGLLPHLLGRPEGHIVNIASMGGFLPVPGQTAYCATKAAVKLLTEGLEAELRATGVRVTVAFPGALNTNIMANSGLAAPGQISGKASRMVLDPTVAAEKIIEAVEANKARVYIGKDSRTMHLLYRLSPGFASNLIYKKMKHKLPAK